jgi:GNAT superfamily N-acetyltransferase
VTKQPPGVPIAPEHDRAYARMEASLLAFWAGLACSSSGACVVRVEGIAAAVFPAAVEREVFNNAVAPRRAPLEGSALAALAALYRDHGIARWQLWVHEDEPEQARRTQAAGMVVDTSTLGMAMPLTREAIDRWPRGALDLVPSPAPEELRELFPSAERILPQLHDAGAHLHLARCEGEPACCTAAFDHAGDCTIQMVGTVERFRRRGLAASLVRHALRLARERGCISASLQATPMAEGVYGSVGFRPLGRYVEWQHRGAAM